jgi:gliding motility-associated-like protein
LSSTVITATIYAGSGCEATDVLNLSVDRNFDIYVPNVFSPNRDDINDEVTVYAGNQVKRIVEFEIFDRWGEKVFSNSDFAPNLENEGWDGYFNGLLMQPGVFVYWAKVLLIDDTEQVISGDITLVR